MSKLIATIVTGYSQQLGFDLLLNNAAHVVPTNSVMKLVVRTHDGTTLAGPWTASNADGTWSSGYVVFRLNGTDTALVDPTNEAILEIRELLVDGTEIPWFHAARVVKGVL